MTLEDKKLLLTDLCGRLPYGVILQYTQKTFFPKREIKVNVKLEIDDVLQYRLKLLDFKPYLRPMSSMTDEEKEELEYICTMCNVDQGSTYESFGIEIFHTSRYGTDFETDYTAIDWFLANHFDFRGLIEKGLALPAPEGMYNIK